MGGGITLHANWLEAFVYSDDTRTEITNITEAGFYATRLEIPDTVTRVSSLETSAVSLTIPASVTSIGNYAFEYCYRLVEVYNLSSLDITIGSEDNGMIGFYAKVIHTSLEEKSNIVESNGVVYYVSGDEKIAVTPVDMNATTVTLDSDCTIIWNYAFFRCSSLTLINIPASVTSINQYAFCNCLKLETVTFEDGSQLTSIGESAFEGCYHLIEVYNLSSLSIIAGSIDNGYVGYYAKFIHKSLDVEASFVESNGVVYYNYNGEKIAVRPVDMNATSVTLDSDCTSINQYAFYWCENLTSITIPANVTSIGNYAFNGCSKLETVTFEEGSQLTSIESYAFSHCSSLTSITIPASVTSIGNYAFYECSSLTSITIPSGVTRIESSAFSGCYRLIEVYNLSSLDITAGSTDNGYVGYYAKFIHKSLDVEASFVESNGVVYYNYNGEKIAVKPVDMNATSVTLDSDCTSINQYAFYRCENLTSITIPANVTSIGKCAFVGCSSLTSINIPASVTSIGGSAFHNCSSLTSITIPASVTSIGSWAFEYCYRLIEVYNLSSLNITAGSSSNGYVGYYAKVVYTSLEEKSNLVESNGVVYYNYNGEKIAVKPVDMNATSVTLDSDCTSIGNGAFFSCSSLTSITIPASVTSIGNYAFYNCSKLENVYYDGTIVDWCNITFDDNYSNPMMYASHFYMKNENGEYQEVTEDIVIPDTVTEIKSNAFYGFKNLTSVTIGKNVTSIGRYAFQNCSNLTTVTFEDGSGWYVSTSSTATSGTKLTLTDTAQNATYLRSTYYNYYWKKSTT